MTDTTTALFAGSSAEATVARPWIGNWDAFPRHQVPQVREAARIWRAQLEGITHPWLCWCVSDPWCVLQQRLVQSVGWTPVVGWDTNIPQPTILPGSIAIDFNAELQMPRCFSYFPLEWIFLFAPERLAFWHVDFLMSRKDMATAARVFASIKDGQVTLPWNRANWLWRTSAPYRPVQNENRLFEVVGCVTTQASREMWEEGLGFWRHPECHPNASLQAKDVPGWEHTVGLTLWTKRHPGRHVVPKLDIKTGHATAWKLGIDGTTTPKQQQLEAHATLHHYAQRVGIADLLEG